MKLLFVALGFLSVAAHAAPAPFVFGSDGKSINLQTGVALPQSPTPAPPVIGRDYLYFKSDDNLYMKNHAGVETQITGGGGGAGNVVGPASSTDTAIALFNGATGKLLSNSAVTVVGSTVTGSLTGAASLNVLKAGDTMTGPLNMPAGSASAAEITGGSANTGFFFPSSATAAFTSGGAEVCRMGANGVTIGNTTAQAVALYVKPTSGTVGLQVEHADNTRKFDVLDATSTNLFCYGIHGTDDQMCMSNVAIGGTGLGWMSFGAHGPDTPPGYPIEFNTISIDGNVTSLTDSAFNYLDGANVNGSPLIVGLNKNASANTLFIWGNTGSSRNLMGGWGTRHVVQTAMSEQADIFLWNNRVGTRTEVMKIRQNGNTEHNGVTPTVSACGTSPSVVGNNNDFRVTVGTGGITTSCLITFATTPAWTNAPICLVNDETGIITVQAVPTTTAVTLNSVAAFAASSVLAVHCNGYF